jgi:hypothetical protein
MYGFAAAITYAELTVLTKSAYCFGSRKKLKKASSVASSGVPLTAKNPSRYAVAPSSGSTHLTRGSSCCTSAVS